MDVGCTELVVTYTNPQGKFCQIESVCFTGTLDETVDILQREGVTDAAMESTGIYGGPLCEKLETSGINVTVINPGMYKKPDDKTDPVYV
jgi:hypothetical protein